MIMDRMRHLAAIVGATDQLPTEAMGTVVAAVNRVVGALTSHEQGRAHTTQAEDALLTLGDSILAARPMAALLAFDMAVGDPVKVMLSWRPIEGLSVRIDSESRINRLRMVLTETLGVLRLPMTDAERVGAATGLIVQALALGTCDGNHAAPACADPQCGLARGNLS